METDNERFTIETDNEDSIETIMKLIMKIHYRN